VLLLGLIVAVIVGTVALAFFDAPNAPPPPPRPRAPYVEDRRV
jgi:hypothetical protein